MNIKSPVLTEGAKPERNEDPFLFHVLEFFLCYRITLLVSVLFVFIVSAIFAFTAQRWYRSEVLLIPRQESSDIGGIGALSGQLGGVAAMAGLDLGGSTSLRDEGVARLKSQEFLQNLIKDEGLMQIMYSDRWDSKAGAWRKTDETPSIEDAFRYFTEDIFFLVEESTTGLVRVAIDWKDANVAASWIQKIVDRINEDMRLTAVRESDVSIAYLEHQLAQTNIVEVRQAIGRLLENQITRKMLSSVRDDYVFRIIDPPHVSDPKRYVRPNRPLIIIGGVFLGLFIGIFLAILHGVLREFQSFRLYRNPPA